MKGKEQDLKCRHELVRSKLRTVYKAKCGATASHFFHAQNRVLGPPSLLPKSSIQECGARADVPSITIEQYFRVIENRPSGEPQHTGKRAVSTAVPGYRHKAKGGDLELDPGVRGQGGLNPVRLTKTRDSRRIQARASNVPMCPQSDSDGFPYSSSINKTVDTRKSREVEGPFAIAHYRDTSCHDGRPDSRYNKNSICAPLDLLRNDNSPVETGVVHSWNPHLRTKRQQNLYNFDNCREVRGSKNSPLNTYWPS